MKIDTQAFRESLSLYGSHVEKWPAEVRSLGLFAKTQPEYAALIEKEKLFEGLLNEATVPPAPADLLTRLLVASAMGQDTAHTPPHVSLLESGSMRPYINRTAFAMMLVIGFAIGFNTVSYHTDEIYSQSYSDDGE